MTDDHDDSIFVRAGAELRRQTVDELSLEGPSLEGLLDAIRAQHDMRFRSGNGDQLSRPRADSSPWRFRAKLTGGALLAAGLVIGFIVGSRGSGRTAVDAAQRGGSSPARLTDMPTGVLPATSTQARVPSSSTRLVNFAIVAPSAARVALVGEFNDWDATATPMTRVGGNEWRVALPLGYGRHVYAFIIDNGRWVTDPSAPIAPERWFGMQRSVMLVSGGVR
jgi:hypothetical protein